MTVFFKPWSAPEPRGSSGGKLVSLVVFDQWDEKSIHFLLQSWGEWAVHSLPTANYTETGTHSGDEVTPLPSLCPSSLAYPSSGADGRAGHQHVGRTTFHGAS